VGPGGRERHEKVWKVWKVFREGIRTRSPKGSLHAEDSKNKLLQVFRRKKSEKEILLFLA